MGSDYRSGKRTTVKPPLSLIEFKPDDFSESSAFRYSTPDSNDSRLSSPHSPPETARSLNEALSAKGGRHTTQRVLQLEHTASASCPSGSAKSTSLEVLPSGPAHQSVSNSLSSLPLSGTASHVEPLAFSQAVSRDPLSRSSLRHCLLSSATVLSVDAASASSLQKTRPKLTEDRPSSPLQQKSRKPRHRRKVHLGNLDARGRGPAHKRWRLYCFRFAFVIEPNIPHLGIRYRFDADTLAENLGMGHRSLDAPNKTKADDANRDPPQLIIFRYSDAIAEVPNSMHQLYSQFGPLDRLYLIDCLVGCLHIADAKFLVVVGESEGVCGFHRHSFLLADTHSRQLPVALPSTAELDTFVYRIKRACLIPFHLSLQPEPTMFSASDWISTGAPTAASAREGSATCDSKDTLPFMSYPGFPASASITPIASDRADGAQCHSSTREPSLHRYVLPPSRLRHPAHLQSSDTDHGAGVSRLSATLAPDPLSVEDSDTSTLSAEGNFDVSCSFRPFPISHIVWCDSGYGTPQLNFLLGEKLAMYKRNIEKLLSSTFYFSYDLDITHTLQRKRQLGIPFAPQGWPCDYVPATRDSENEQGKKPAPPDLLTDTGSISAADQAVDEERQEDATPSGNDSDPSSIRFMDIADKRFVWNLQLSQPFLAWSIDSRWLVPVIQGSVTSVTVVSGIHGLDIVLMCRRSWCRAGTRYNHRGIDDSGNVANFNESEQLVAACRVNPDTGQVIHRGVRIANGGWASFVQIRGSVPLFWEQTSSLSINPTPQLTRQVDFALKAFTMHQTQLARYYGRVCYIDLLSTSKAGEHKLSSSLQGIIDQFNMGLQQNATLLPTGDISTASVTSEKKHVSLVQWDFHQQIKMSGFEEALARLVEHLRPYLQEFGYYCEKPLYTERPAVQYQKGCVRTNCLDCLDRTNALQWFLCWSWIAQCLTERGLRLFLSSGIRGAVNTIFPTASSDEHFPLNSVPEPQTSRPASPAPDVDVWSYGSDDRRARAKGLPTAGTMAPLSGVHRSPQSPAHVTPQKLASKRRHSEIVGVHYFGGDDGAVSWTYRIMRTRPPPGILRGNARQLGGSSSPDLPHHSLSPGPQVDPPEMQGLAGDFCSNILKEVVARMWADHGDHISRAYTGTDSVMSSLIRQGKSSLATNMVHMMTSIGRFYQNTFEDAARQDAIELLLNQHDTLSQRYSSPTAEDLHGNGSVTPQRVAAVQGASSPESRGSWDGSQFGPKEGNIPLRIWYGTWNLGGRLVPEPFERWLFPREKDTTGRLMEASTATTESDSADVYVIAVQELVELTKVRVLLSQGDREKEGQLELNIQKTLGPDYIMLKSHSLVGLHLAVFVKSSLKHHVTQVHTSDVKLGFKGQMGNKGAVFLRLVLGNASFCFVNVHLSSGAEKARQRRDQLQTILESLFQTRPPFRVQQHDCVLLGGDFNFRCNASAQESQAWAKSAHWNELLFRDQFVVGKRLQLPPFRDVYERPIDFTPTYKFRKGTNHFDHGRSPGWCDRVLYTGNFMKQMSGTRGSSSTAVPRIQCLDYNSVRDFLSSDHKPVYAIFQVMITIPPNAQGQPFSWTPVSYERLPTSEPADSKFRVLAGHQEHQPLVRTVSQVSQKSSGSSLSLVRPPYSDALDELNDLTDLGAGHGGPDKATPRDRWSAEGPLEADRPKHFYGPHASYRNDITATSKRLQQKPGSTPAVSTAKKPPLLLRSSSPSGVSTSPVSFCYAPFYAARPEGNSAPDDAADKPVLHWGQVPWTSLSSAFSSYPVPPRQTLTTPKQRVSTPPPPSGVAVDQLESPTASTKPHVELRRTPSRSLNPLSAPDCGFQTGFVRDNSFAREALTPEPRRSSPGLLSFEPPKHTPVESTVSPPSLLTDIYGSPSDPSEEIPSNLPSRGGPFVIPYETGFFPSPAPSPPSLLDD